jgi:hypothetical protein
MKANKAEREEDEQTSTDEVEIAYMFLVYISVIVEAKLARLCIFFKFP